MQALMFSQCDIVTPSQVVEILNIPFESKETSRCDTGELVAPFAKEVIVVRGITTKKSFEAVTIRLHFLKHKQQG
jgi:hypothetical protein